MDIENLRLYVWNVVLKNGVCFQISYVEYSLDAARIGLLKQLGDINKNFNNNIGPEIQLKTTFTTKNEYYKISHFHYDTIIYGGCTLGHFIIHAEPIISHFMPGKIYVL